MKNAISMLGVSHILFASLNLLVHKKGRETHYKNVQFTIHPAHNSVRASVKLSNCEMCLWVIVYFTLGSFGCKCKVIFVSLKFSCLLGIRKIGNWNHSILSLFSLRTALHTVRVQSNRETESWRWMAWAWRKQLKKKLAKF